MTTAVVVPTNRPACIVRFLKEWEPQFHKGGVRLLVIQDFPVSVFPWRDSSTHQLVDLPTWVESYTHQDIDGQLGDNAWCIAKRHSAIRSFGFWLAAQDPEVDVIISLDDDVYPLLSVDLIAEHRKALDKPRHLRWWPVANIHTRGYPYTLPAVCSVLNHGLWVGHPDLDSKTKLRAQLACPSATLTNWSAELAQSSTLVPPGMYFTMCCMNIAFRREMAPFVYMPLLPDGMRNWNDIWAGIIFKRIADLMGWAVTSGEPEVRHECSSTPIDHLDQEYLGYEITEELWKLVDSVTLVQGTIQTYRRIAEAIGNAFPSLRGTVNAMNTWASLWDSSLTPKPIVALEDSPGERMSVTFATATAIKSTLKNCS